ncbi:MAG TPA: phosphate signaling complex protein PhoU [Anaerolineae bacterium]|nr:phosphate signaling complex protein PhoU [Anaerolineae bacterium]
MVTRARSLFEQELRTLQDNVLQLGRMVEEAIAEAVEALKERDVARAEQVIAHDEVVNRLRFDIEEQCLRLIATQQPTARDLRAIIAAVHIAVELERMGDHAAGIGVLTTRLADRPHIKPLIDVPRMARIDQEMIRESLKAYVEEDAELAAQVAERDDEIDHLYDQIYRELLVFMMEDPHIITRATWLLWVGHNLERIADRVTNICERVIFMVTGELRELQA